MIETHDRVIALVKGKERWVWIYTAAQRFQVMQSMYRCACDPNTNFTVADYNRCALKVREELAK